jgi:hypothetical protein
MEKEEEFTTKDVIAEGSEITPVTPRHEVRTIKNLCVLGVKSF